MTRESPSPGENAQRYQDYFELSPDGIFVADARGHYVEVNAAAARLTGYSREELLTMSIPDILSDEARVTGMPRFQRVKDLGHSEGEIQGKRKDGTHYWMTIDAVKLSDDRFIAFCKDTNQRHVAEEALRSIEERFRALMTHTQGVIFVVDRTGTFTLSEGKGLASLGLEPGQVVGTSAFELYADYPTITSGIETALAGEATHTLARVGDLSFDIFFSPIREENIAVSGVIGMAVEVTARIQAEEERLRISQQMERSQRLESLGVLAGGVAHDFNNLLMSILGSAELLESNLESGGPGKKLTGRIVSAAEQAAELCQQLLAYAGRVHIDPRPFDLSSCLQEMAPLLDVAATKKVTIEWDLPEGLPEINGDPGQLRQVAVNMVTNASEAIGDRSGTIRVRTFLETYSADDLLNFDLAEPHFPGRHVGMEISDTGSGMNKETATRVFDPFFTTKATGRGLGMASARGIIHSHQGGLRIESTPGEGTTITALFPAGASCTPTRKSAPTVAPDSDARTGGTILVVDDEEMVRDTARAILEASGFEVVDATDGTSALERLAERPEHFRAVLLDMTMPRMTGRECHQAIRAMLPRLPIVLTSGYSAESVEGLLQQHPATTFVQKPFRIARLRAAFDAAIRACDKSDSSG